MKSSHATLRILGAFAVALTLAACGGGSSSGNNNDYVPTRPANEGTLQGKPPTPDYPADGGLRDRAFAQLNSYRSLAGAGFIHQSKQLDVAAEAHAKYLTTNGFTSFADANIHLEESSKPDFYAFSEQDRAWKAGYATTWLFELIGSTGASGYGDECVKGFMSSIHLATRVLGETTHVGIGAGRDMSDKSFCVLKLAFPQGMENPQVPASGQLITWPYADQTLVSETYQVGNDRPRPSPTLFPNATAGTPVIVRVRNVDYLNAWIDQSLDVVVTRFELKDNLGNRIPAGVIAASEIRGSSDVTVEKDPALLPGYAILIPFSPLDKGKTYTVEFAATLKSGGAPLTKSWSFSTSPI